ncbi:hypothetical protein Tco_0524941 [Tanacetum coccineum]
MVMMWRYCRLGVAVLEVLNGMEQQYGKLLMGLVSDSLRRLFYKNNDGGRKMAEVRCRRVGLESKVMRECCFVVGSDAWLRDEFTLSSLEVLQGFSFFLQIGFTLILATFDGLDVGLLEDVIGEDDCDDDDCDEEMFFWWRC